MKYKIIKSFYPYYIKLDYIYMMQIIILFLVGNFFMEFLLVPIEPGIVYNSIINFLNNLAIFRHNVLRSLFLVSDAILYDLDKLLRVLIKLLNYIKTPGNPFEGEGDNIVFLTILHIKVFHRWYWLRPNKASLIFYYNSLNKNLFSRYCERLFTKIVSMFYKKKSLVMYYCILENKKKTKIFKNKIKKEILECQRLILVYKTQIIKNKNKIFENKIQFLFNQTPNKILRNIQNQIKKEFIHNKNVENKGLEYKIKNLENKIKNLENKIKIYNKDKPCENEIFRFVFESFEFYRSDPASLNFYYSPGKLLELPDGFDIYCIRNKDFFFHELKNNAILIFINRYSYKRMMADFMNYTLDVYTDESFGKMEPVMLEDRIKYITLNVKPDPLFIEQVNETGFYKFKIEISRMLDPLYTWEIKHFPYLWAIIYGFECVDRIMKNLSNMINIFMVDRLIQSYFYIMMETSIFWFNGLILAFQRIKGDYYISDRLTKIKLDLCSLVSFDTSANFGSINHFFHLFFKKSQLKLKELIDVYKRYSNYKRLNAFISKYKLTLSFLFFEEKLMFKLKEKIKIKLKQICNKKLSVDEENNIDPNNDLVFFNINLTNSYENFRIKQIELIKSHFKNYIAINDKI